MLSQLRRLIPENSPLRLTYHKIVAILAAVFYGFPAGKMHIIAVTGTEGKTTVCQMIAKILMENGKRVAMATTQSFRIGDNIWHNTTKQTTVSRFALQSFLKKALLNGCEYAIIETTSHAMVQSRLWGINVDTAVLTNVNKDHLEYHGSFQNYRSAKAKLFRDLRFSRRKPGIQKISILNRDDENYSYFEKLGADRVFSYGLKGKAMIRANNLNLKPNGSSFTLEIPNNSTKINLQVPGEVNISNALASISVGIANNISLHAIKKALNDFKGVPGRMESLDEGQLFSVIVDYGHTPHALEKLFQVFKPLTAGKLIAVFGATGGGRDINKRPFMGEVADKYADIIILTNDDPYSDNQIKIIEDIAKGIKRKEGENFWKIPDRKEAIRLGLMLARQEDTIIVAGKGGEKVMAINGKLIPWSDEEIIRELLNRKIKIEIDGEEEELINACFASNL